MGQCVSHEPNMIIRNQIAAPPSVSDNPSQDNQSQQLSDVTVPADQITPMDEHKLEDLTRFYEGVTKKNSSKKSLGRSSLSSFMPKVKGSIGRPKAERNNHLSAAFNMSFNKFDVVKLDINLATEEELMTLTGITRSIAHEIIEHRNAIGAFKKVEDLALVSGVGAAKLQLIKPEVCIGKKLPSSSTASVTTADASTSSLNGNAETISVASSPKQERMRRRRRDPVSINTGNMFQLMTVDGITQELAAHILHYREKKGPYKTLYDLRKVPGFNTRLISALGPYLTTEANPMPVVSNQPSSLQNGHVPSHRRTASLPSGPLMNAGGFVRPSSPVLTTPSVIYPSVSQFTSVVNRQISSTNGDAQSDDEDLITPSENALRILSWNLDGLSLEKARNPGVVSVISSLLVRHHVSVAVFQGDVDSLALKELCEDINKQEGPSALDPPYSCTATDNGIGYLHRVALQVNGSSLAAGSVPLNLATVKGGNAEFTLVTYSLTKGTMADPLPPTTLVPQVVKSVMDLSPTEMIVCLADMRHNDHAQYVEEFQNLGYRPIITKGESTSYVKGTDVQSNILVSRYAQKALSGQWGVIRRGLTHILIPNGWSWNGPASLYCPVWVELKTDDVLEMDETSPALG